jgi:hypothetical protein
MAAAKKSRGSVPKAATDERRRWVEELWIRGMNISELARRVAKETGIDWSRKTIARDLKYVRDRWGKESSERTRECRRGELDRMARLVYQTAMDRKKAITVREAVKDEKTGKPTGDYVTKTIAAPDPDLPSANAAIQRLQSLHGLDIAKVEGDVTVTGLAALFGQLAADEE